MCSWNFGTLPHIWMPKKTQRSNNPHSWLKFCYPIPGMQFFSVLNADGELARERDPHMTGDPNSDARRSRGSSVLVIPTRLQNDTGKPFSKMAASLMQPNCKVNSYWLLVYIDRSRKLRRAMLFLVFVSASHPQHGDKYHGYLGILVDRDPTWACIQLNIKPSERVIQSTFTDMGCYLHWSSFSPDLWLKWLAKTT